MKKILPVFCSWLVVAAAGCAGPLDAERPSEPRAPDALDSLRWLAGHWRHEGETRVVEELWLPPRSGSMFGINRTIKKDGSRGTFEFLRIEHQPEGIFYRASPNDRPAVAFALVEQGEGHVVFANPNHDFPTRIEYRLLDDGRLQAAATGDDGNGPSWTWERVGSLR